MVSVGTLVLAFGLSADAFAASLAKGAQFRRLSTARSAAIAASFATLEALAPLIGWLVGSRFGHWVAPFDHWVSFGVLGALGVRMIVQGITAGKEGRPSPAPTMLAMVAVALGTSIDGAAVGVTLALVSERIVPMLAAIATVTFGMAWIGLRIGHGVGMRVGRIVEILGGIGLIAIGTKILVEHLLAG
jgi:manganese efflux pump family protein